jgi:hypothetical protein
MSADFSISDPQSIATRGEEIYRTKYQHLERENTGRFVAIDVTTDEAYLGDTSERALQDARDASPEGLFHLIQIGHRGAYRVSYSLSETSVDWIFG